MKDKILIVLVIILLLGLVGLGVFTYNLYQQVDKNELENAEKNDNNSNNNNNNNVNTNDNKEEAGMTDQEILTLGKRLYDEAIDVIGKLTFGASGIVKQPIEFDERYPGYMKTTVTIDEMRNNILKDFTEKFKDGILDPSKGIPDKDIIRVAGNEVFVVDAARGVNMSYAWRDELEIENATNDKIEFNVLRKYIETDRFGEKFSGTDFSNRYETYDFLDSDLEVRIHKFVILKENGSFKISEFNLPY